MNQSVEAAHSDGFGLKLKSLREQSGLSMRALSKSLEVSTSYISLLEAGERNPSRQFVLKTGEYFFNENPEKSDELLVLAGFIPENYKSFVGRNEVIKIYKQALKENPQDFKTYIGLVLVLIRSGQHEEAQTWIDKGLQDFDQLSQLQSLLATLELSKQNFELAIEYQAAAIKYFHLETDKEGLSFNLSDLLLSSGVMHFMKGYRHIDKYYALREAQKTGECQSELSLALNTLGQAKRIFKEALQLVPDDIYILDELARVNFNLAYIQADPQLAMGLWQESILSFEKVILSEDKHALGSQNLLETNIYLAHAYTKSEQFQRAYYLLNVVESCAPHYWMSHYAKACYYSLKFEFISRHRTEEALLDKALVALKMGMKTEEGRQAIGREAPHDRDLQALREYRNQAFEALMQQKHFEVEL